MKKDILTGNTTDTTDFHLLYCPSNFLRFWNVKPYLLKKPSARIMTIQPNCLVALERRKGGGWEKRRPKKGWTGRINQLFSRFHIQTAEGMMRKDFEWIRLDLITYLISVGRESRDTLLHLRRKPSRTKPQQSS
ncbi:unnamed protein product [Wuchereria bancrofti]|uniref:Uncharacterized protein n=1 Tax=Wuchereria bancrofti TaxID=6293 RepID=A0A3P7ET57_WUCBA|nr:unnamed protein product [Wuchereria bancrofti]